MNTNNNQPITAALPELAVIGNLIIEGKKSRPGSKKMLGFPEWFKYRQSSLSDSAY